MADIMEAGGERKKRRPATKKWALHCKQITVS